MTSPALFIALLDGETGAYGVSFPDLPGCVAMGLTIAEAQENAVDALRAWVIATESGGGEVPPMRTLDALAADPDVAADLRAGAMIVAVPLLRETKRQVKANLSLDEGILAAIDATAERTGVTRSGLVETLAKRHLHELV